MFENGFGSFDMTEKQTEQFGDLHLAPELLKCFKNIKNEKEESNIPPDVGMDKITHLLLWTNISLLTCLICLCVEHLIRYNTGSSSVVSHIDPKDSFINDMVIDIVNYETNNVINGLVHDTVDDEASNAIVEAVNDRVDDWVSDEVKNDENESGLSVECHQIKPFIIQCKELESTMHNLPGSIVD